MASPFHGVNRSNPVGVTKRRWLRFSVRTLLVAVTIFCVWLGWQVSIVRERNAIRSLVEKHHGMVTWAEADRPPKLTWIRRICGDQEVERITLWPFFLTDQEQAVVTTTFPEAEISQFAGCFSFPAGPERRLNAEQRHKQLMRARQCAGPIPRGDHDRHSSGTAFE